MKFTYFGQSCFLAEFSGKKLLFDPFISGNPLAKHIDIDSIQADYIIVSHGHGDHIADLFTIAGNTGAKVIANYEIIAWVESKHYSNTHGMNFGPYDFDFGKLIMVPAVHSSALPDGTYGGNPCGFIVKGEKECFYYSGDTCLTMEMQTIPLLAQASVALMPIGGNFTMDAEQAAIAADFVKCDKIIGLHYDTFPPISIDKKAAKEIFTKNNKELILLDIGASIEI